MRIKIALLVILSLCLMGSNCGGGCSNTCSVSGRRFRTCVVQYSGCNGATKQDSISLDENGAGSIAN